MEAGLELTWWVWVVIYAAMLAAGLVQGMFGFGFPIIATPLTVLVTDVKTAIVLNMLPTLTLNLASSSTAIAQNPAGKCEGRESVTMNAER